MTQNLPAVIYHSLNELTQKNELEIIIRGTFTALSSKHISAIVNAFF